MTGPVGKCPSPGQVFHGLLAVGHGVQGVRGAGDLEGAFKKEDVVFR